MRAFVRWPGVELYAGPFEMKHTEKGNLSFTTSDVVVAWIPPSACITSEDWTLWEGGECPVAAETRIEYLLRNGDDDCQPAEDLSWKIEGELSDIIAYRVVEPAHLPLSTILDPTLWWEDCEQWIQANWYIPLADKPISCGGINRPLSWFTNRRHLTAAELAEELEARNG